MGRTLRSWVARLFKRRSQHETRVQSPPPRAEPPRPASGPKEAFHNLHCHARASRGFQPFVRTERLDDAAQALADAMARDLLVSHRAGGSSFEERLWAVGVSADVAAEVIAVGHPRAVDAFNAIVREHATRLCVTQPTLYKYVGYGLAADGAGLNYWCVVYTGIPHEGTPRVYTPPPVVSTP